MAGLDIPGVVARIKVEILLTVFFCREGPLLLSPHPLVILMQPPTNYISSPPLLPSSSPPPLFRSFPSLLITHVTSASHTDARCYIHIHGIQFVRPL